MKSQPSGADREANFLLQYISIFSQSPEMVFMNLTNTLEECGEE